MDDLGTLVERAADLAGVPALDTDALIAATRGRRRGRARLQVSSAAGSVVVIAVGAAVVLGSPGGPRGTSVAASTAPASARVASPRPFGTPSPTRPTFVNPTLRVPPSVPAAAAPRNLPPDLDQVCGKPGSTLTVRILPVVIPYRVCDVRGVQVVSGGIAVTVPTRQGAGAGAERSSSSRSPGGLSQLSARSDGRTGDVTITGR